MSSPATDEATIESPPSHAEASAPGRVCLLGEHCDWAGFGACLVSPLDRHVLVRAAVADVGLRARSAFGRSLFGPDGRAVRDDPNRYISAVARVMIDDGVPVPPARVAVESDLPAGRGFSSSAAVCVATASALAQLAGVTPEPARLADWATRAERDRLGVNIGRMDPLACAYAQPLFIDWGPPERLQVIDAPPLPLLAAAFPSGRSAELILAALGEALRAGHEGARRAIRTWGEAAVVGASALRLQDLAALGAQLDRAQAAYEALDLPALAAPQLVEACAALRAAGALGAKFTGAGGDGSLVALFADAAGLEAGRALLEARGMSAL